MNKTRAAAFNEWMRLYTEEPARFRQGFESVVEFLCEQSEGQELSYGQRCDAYLAKLEAELAEAPMTEQGRCGTCQWWGAPTLLGYRICEVPKRKVIGMYGDTETGIGLPTTQVATIADFGCFLWEAKDDEH